MMVKKFKTLKSKIEDILEKFPETRSDDTLLCVRIVQSMGGSSIEDLSKIHITSVHKLRQLIQNKDGKFLPPDKVQKKRKALDGEMRDYFSQYATNAQEEVLRSEKVYVCADCGDTSPHEEDTQIDLEDGKRYCHDCIIVECSFCGGNGSFLELVRSSDLSPRERDCGICKGVGAIKQRYLNLAGR